MTIKDAAAQTGLTPKSIRYYESKGLLSIARGAENAYRHYTEADIEQLKRIKVLRWLGLSVEEIGGLAAENWEKLPAALSEHSLKLRESIDQLEEKQGICEKLLAAIREGTADNLIERYRDRIDKREIAASDTISYRVPDGCFLTCDSGFGQSYLSHDPEWGTVDVSPPETVTIWDEETKPGFGKLLRSFLLRFFGFIFWLIFVGFDREFLAWENRVFPYLLRLRLRLNGASNCRLVIEDSGSSPSVRVSGPGAELIEQSWTPALWRYDVACYKFLCVAFAGWFWASCLIGALLWAALRNELTEAAFVCGIILAFLLIAVIVIFRCHLKKLKQLHPAKGFR